MSEATQSAFRLAIDYAILAPSSHNSQPWLFSITPTALELFADRSRALPVVDPEDRELTMSCGAALFHLKIALRHLGHAPVVTIVPEPDNPDLLARVTIDGPYSADGDEHALFRAIADRKTYRHPFEDQPVRTEDQKSLEAAAVAEGAWFAILSEENDRTALANLVGEADRLQTANRHFRRELASWIHSNRSRTQDGIPGYSFGLGAIRSEVFPHVVRTFDTGNRRAAADHEIALGSPLLAVLGTEQDVPRDWMMCGEALDHVLLQASSMGIAASFLNQPIEVPELRTEVQHLTGQTGYSQLILRMGYPARRDLPPTPRRPAHEVLM